MTGPDLAAFRDPALARRLIDRIRDLVGERQVSLMEVCGTHTMNIARYGFRSVLPKGLRLLSGPGCPVCVTANADVDRIVALARVPGTVLATFGDMVRVPGSDSSLMAEKAAGADVRVTYSPLDALDIAERNPDREVVFAGVGFETTAPAVAACILEAQERGLRNFSVACVHKVTPPALDAIARDPLSQVDGFLLPGHVATVTGTAPFAFLPERYGLPGVVTGFEPVDILAGMVFAAGLAMVGRPAFAIAYRRGAADGGNPHARALVERVFRRADAVWRGLGPMPRSGLEIAPEYRGFDAFARFDVAVGAARETPGCRCGDVLRGRMEPAGCPLFGRACTPEHPVGPCMVSSEGSCAASWRYREEV